MLQSLLEERFGLKVHRETKTRQGFALMVGKNGPKLKPAQPPPDPQKRMADFQKRMQENQESGTPRVGLSRANFPSIATEALAAPIGAIRRSACGRRDRSDRKYSLTIEIWKNADVPGGTFSMLRKTRPETGAAQGDRRNRGGRSGLQNAHGELGDPAS
jgi:uncharacterized protein (TIGR03435 family)